MSRTPIHIILYGCNICGNEARYESYVYHDDLPDGWVEFIDHGEGEEWQHACSSCAYLIHEGHRIY